MPSSPGHRVCIPTRCPWPSLPAPAAPDPGREVTLPLSPQAAAAPKGQLSSSRGPGRTLLPLARPPAAALTVGVDRSQGGGRPVLGLEAGRGAARGRYPRLEHDEGGYPGRQGVAGDCDSARRKADRRLLEAKGGGSRLRAEGGEERRRRVRPLGVAPHPPPVRRRPRPGLGTEVLRIGSVGPGMAVC